MNQAICNPAICLACIVLHYVLSIYRRKSYNSIDKNDMVAELIKKNKY